MLNDTERIAVLEIPVPEDCTYCPLLIVDIGERYGSGRGHCIYTPGNQPAEIYNAMRAPWCGLKILDANILHRTRRGSRQRRER